MHTVKHSVPVPVKRFAVAAAVAITADVSGITGASAATVCFDPTSTCAVGTETKVNLNGSSGTSGTGLAGTTTVDFSSTTSVDLASGFANIKPTTGKSFGDLTLTTPGFTFTDLAYDVQLFNNKTAPTLGFTVSAFDGATLEGTKTYTGLKHDADLSFFLSSTTPLTEVDLTSTSGFKEVKHFQLSGLTAVTTTPLPASWTMMLIGLAGLGFFGYRRRNQSAMSLVA